MLLVISDYELDIKYPYLERDDIDSFDMSIQIIIIDYDKLNFNLIEKIFSLKKAVRIIVLSNEYKQSELVKCYQHGVDQYIFDLDIMNDHLNCILDRLNKRYNLLAQIYCDLETQQVMYNDEVIKLPKMEFKIFKYLSEHLGQEVKTSTILVDILGYHADSETRLVSVYMRYIRQRIEHLDLEIITIRGIGYKMEIK